MLGASEVLIFSASLFLIFLVKTVNKKPPPIFGIYQRPIGFYWFKVGFMYLVLFLRQLRFARKNDENLWSDLERPHKLSLNEKAVDAVYLNGANKSGDHLVVGTARRKNLLVDGFLYLKINSSNLGLLESPKLPDTALYKAEDSEEFSAEGIKMSPLEPMRKWRLTYEGIMKEHNNRSVIHDVRIDGIWTSDLPYFNFDGDIDPYCMASAMAHEKWSRSYFETLKQNHQTHYEQFGKLKATVTIDEANYNVELDTLRDHSFGKCREWRQMKRYSLHIFSSENGDRFSLVNLCLPIAFSRLTAGFVYSAEAKKMFPIQECDLELYQHGELGTLPKDYAFSIVAGNRQYIVKVDVVDSPHMYMSKDWELKIFETLCKFEVNGVEGWGGAEWAYRNIQGKDVQD